MEELIKNINDSEFETEVLKNGKVKIVKINVDESEKIALAYNIVSIPTLMIFVNGELKEKTVGLTSSGELSEMLIRYIG